MKKSKIDDIIKFYIRNIWLSIACVVLTLIGTWFLFKQRPADSQKMTVAQVVYNGRLATDAGKTVINPSANISEIMKSKSVIGVVADQYSLTIADLEQQLLVSHFDKNDLIRLVFSGKIDSSQQQLLLRRVVELAEAKSKEVYGVDILDWVDEPMTVDNVNAVSLKKELIKGFVYGLVIAIAVTTGLYFYKKQ